MLPMVACVISLDSPTVILARKSLNSYLCNASLEDFEANKFPQYHDLTSSFVRRFEYSSSHNSPSVMFDLYDKSYRMDLEDFTLACKLP